MTSKQRGWDPEAEIQVGGGRMRRSGDVGIGMSQFSLVIVVKDGDSRVFTGRSIFTLLGQRIFDVLPSCGFKQR